MVHDTCACFYNTVCFILCSAVLRLYDLYLSVQASRLRVKGSCAIACVHPKVCTAVVAITEVSALLLGQPCLTPSPPREDLCRLFASEASWGLVRSLTGSVGYLGCNCTFTGYQRRNYSREWLRSSSQGY